MMIVIRLICAVCLHIKDLCYDGGYKNKIGRTVGKFGDRAKEIIISFDRREIQRSEKPRFGAENEVVYDVFL